MDASPRRIELLRRMAGLCAVLVLAVTSLSAFMRLDKAGLGCTPWPQCHAEFAAGQSPGADASASNGHAVAAARLAHRLAATVVLLLALVMVMTVWSEQPRPRRELHLALGILGLVGFLAALGRWSADPKVPAVTVGNLLGGYGLFALAYQLAQPRRLEMPTVVRAWAWAGVALLTLQIALGGLTSANHAGAACPKLVGCDVAAASWRALDPWRDLGSGALSAADAAWLQLVHRSVAVATAAVLLVLVGQAWRRERRSAATVLGLLVLQLAVGAVQVQAGLPMAAAMAHNLLAALLLGSVAKLASSAAPPQTITGSGSSRMPKRP